MTTATDIRDRFPGAFPATTAVTTALDAAIADAELRISATAFGKRRALAVMYLAAHMAFVGTNPRLLSGATSVAAGQVSMSFQLPGGGQTMRTGFSDLYDGLKRGRIFVPRAV